MSDARAEHSRFAAIFAGGTSFSRILGLVRDLTFSALIPAVSFDAWVVAFRLPNMLRELIGEGASNAAFVPVFSEKLENESEEAFRETVSAAMGAMLMLLAGLTLAGIFAIPPILSSLEFLETFTQREGVTQEWIAFLTDLSMFTFPYLFFIGMAVFCMAPLFTLQHYFTPSWSPALLNVSLIGACVLLRDAFVDPAYALVLGVWIGGLAQLAVQYVALGRIAGVWRPRIVLGHPDVRRMFLLLIPVVFGQAAGEVNRLVDTLFAASLPDEGTVRSLFLANRLVQLPLSIFAVATSVAILPTLSRSGARNAHEEIRETLLLGLRQSAFLVVPALAGLMVMGQPIVRLLFERGYFNPGDTRMTATALVIYAAGLLSFAWVKVCVTGFYAVQNTRTPVLIATGSMLFNILLNFALVGPLGYAGLALATTIAYTVNALFLYLFLWNRFGPLYDGAFVSTLIRIAAATLGMVAVTYAVYVNLFGFLGDEGLAARLIVTLGPIAAAIATYLGLSRALHIEELGGFTSILRRRR